LEKSFVPKQETPQIVSVKPVEPTPAPVANPASSNLKPDSATTALNRAVDALLSPQTSFNDKQAVWKKLKDAGELDQAIAELKQRAVNNPNDANIPVTLGETQLHKADVLSRNGGNLNELGILGMQADQSFDAALKLDPANWEAQFFKATSLSYWPAELNKGPEVIQRLSHLIDQQEAMAPQPQFAQTYVVLGNQYLKSGKPDYAQQTWQLGLANFPNDPTLREKINHPSGR
jgi:tetratricopeptide (TPR) repeat protein